MAEEEVVILEAEPSSALSVVEEGFAPIEEESADENAAASTASDEDEQKSKAKKKLLTVSI